MLMSLTRPSPEFVPSTTLHEAILASSSSVRDSLPEQHRAHFETLRQEIIDFAKAHDISRESLTKPDALREAAEHLSIPDLERLATLLERFEYLLKNGEPMREKLSEAREYAEEFYHLREQYDSQVALLEQVGVLKDGAIIGIDGNTYSIPTLEQIADRLFERRETLETKHEQGFTKLLLVPFGMSLDSLREIFEQFLFAHTKDTKYFGSYPLWISSAYPRADVGDFFSELIYHPKSFDKNNHQGKTKIQILKKQQDNPDSSFPGWVVHLFQPSDPSNPDSPGFAPISRKSQGTTQGEETPRPHLEAGKTAEDYFSILQKAQDNRNSPYHGETGLTPEDGLMAFMTHFTETRKPLDDAFNNQRTEVGCYLTGAFFLSDAHVPCMLYDCDDGRVRLGGNGPSNFVGYYGLRSSIIV